MLQRGKDSLIDQTDSDWEQIILVDDGARGIEYANGMLVANKEQVKGQYVYILDDDHRLIVPDFVAGIRAIVEASTPDVVMVKARKRVHGLLPRKWGSHPQNGSVDTANFVVRNEIWQEHIGAFHRPSSGDFYFINEIFSDPKLKVEWWDYIVSEDMRDD